MGQSPPVLDARRLRILREVAACGTIAAAADALHLTASAVSQQLSALERETGETLLERHGRGVRLTPAGRVLVDHAHRVIAQLELAEADLAALHEGPTGRLRVRTFPTAGIGLVAPALARLREEHPRLVLEVEESDAAIDAQGVTSGAFDVALALLLPGAVGADDPGVTAIRLLDDPYDCALPSGHRLAGRDAVPLPALADERWIVPAGATAWEANVRLACATAGFTPRIAHRASEYGLALALVQAGAGVALVPRLAKAGVPAGVVLHPLAAPGAYRRVGVLVRRGGESHPGVAAVLDALRWAAGR